MNILLGFLFFLYFVFIVFGTVFGLLNPKIGLFWKNDKMQTRKNVGIYYGMNFCIFYMLLFVISTFWIQKISTFLFLFNIIFIPMLFLILFIGIIKPKWVLFWLNKSERTRKKVFLFYGLAFLFLILCIAPVNGRTSNKELHNLQTEEKEFANQEDSAQKEKEQREKEQREKEQKEKEQREKEQKEKEKEQREKEQKEKEQREKEQKEKEQREKEQKEKEQKLAKEIQGYDFNKKKKKILGTIEHYKQTMKPEYMSQNKHWWKGTYYFETDTDRTAYETYLYIGKIKDGKPHGIGAVYKKTQALGYDLYYAGEFSEGFLNGFGLHYEAIDEFRYLANTIMPGENFPSFLVYEGYFKDGAYSGKGNKRLPILFLDTQESVNGELRERSSRYLDENERKWGSSTSESYTEFFRDDRTIPLATYVSETGSYKDGELNGKGMEFRNESEIIYSGEYRNGKYNGKGIVYYHNGKKEYEGSFSNGEYDGEGTLYTVEGKIDKNGKWKKGDWKGSN